MALVKLTITLQRYPTGRWSATVEDVNEGATCAITKLHVDPQSAADWAAQVAQAELNRDALRIA